MKKARHNKIITGLPDTYGRGRIVGDYRRVALYGIDYLLEEKENDFANCGCGVMTDDVIRLREEIAEQKKALKGMKEMAQIYGFDISRPAKTAKEAIQWMYFGYLAAIKTQNGAAMSIGRVATFLDIYIPVSYTHLQVLCQNRSLEWTVQECILTCLYGRMERIFLLILRIILESVRRLFTSWLELWNMQMRCA